MRDILKIGSWGDGSDSLAKDPYSVILALTLPVACQIKGRAFPIILMMLFSCHLGLWKTIKKQPSSSMHFGLDDLLRVPSNLKNSMIL